MLFNSLEFAVFFPIVTVLFFLLPHRLRWILLLAASCFFYMFFKPVYILILVFTIIIDYYAGIWIGKEPDKKKKRLLLSLSIIANVGVLAVFKYYNFLAENLNIVLHSFNEHKTVPLLNILLPIGLSFHTFQAMSYTIEVYKGRQKPEKHFGIYALYVMFYPQLVAGPIERPQNVLPQFYEVKKFSYENMKRGLILIAWGLFKKVVIADRLALFVNEVYGNPFDYKGIPLVTGTIFFAFQIFCDFSGYSDIALGTAQCMGFNLMKNFDRPYMAQTIGEFWRRWHISLSTWFRDYVYIPLGGNKVSKRKWYRNILIVFVLSGIWHGANWTFAIWGLLHGIYLIVEVILNKKNGRTDKSPPSGFIPFLKRIYVFVLVALAWVFFRANNVSQAFYIIRNFFSEVPAQLLQILHNENFLRLKLLYIGQAGSDFFIALFFLGVMTLIHFRQKSLSFDEWLVNKPVYVRWSLYYGLTLSFICFGIFNKSGFIYFQF
jgi:alginate O-acetyltransferase complex protein AlgI